MKQKEKDDQMIAALGWWHDLSYKDKTHILETYHPNENIGRDKILKLWIKLVLPSGIDSAAIPIKEIFCEGEDDIAFDFHKANEEKPATPDTATKEQEVEKLEWDSPIVKEVFGEGKEGFTGGNWSVDGLAVDSDQFEICVMSSDAKDMDENQITYEECEANARLIAEAPAMYKFIKEMAFRYANSEWIAGEAKEIINRINQK